MLCSQARSQPACFSGRTIPCPAPIGQTHPSQKALKRIIKIFAATQQGGAKEEAEALRISAADLRAKLSSFDSKSFPSKAGQKREEGEKDAPAVALLPLTRDISSEVLVATIYLPACGPGLVNLSRHSLSCRVITFIISNMVKCNWA